MGDFAHSGIDLEPDTTYFLVLDSETEKVMKFYTTDSTDEWIGGAVGWSIATTA